jgi:translocation protein SEC63
MDTTSLLDHFEQSLTRKQSATDKQITSHYRRLSKTHHPDKAREDLAHNITKDFINDRWVDIVKAHKALTDEEIRNNFLQYGHPDGKQSFSIGIALPKWIITDGHGKYVLLMYALALGVLLPYTVGKWWYGTQRMTKEKILVASAGKLFREYDNDQGDSGVVGVLSSGEEFNEILAGHKAEEGLSKLEQKVLADGSETAISDSLTKKDREKLQDLEDSRRRKVLTLLWAYLGRIELDDETLNDGKKHISVRQRVRLTSGRKVRSRSCSSEAQRGLYIDRSGLWQHKGRSLSLPHIAESDPGVATRCITS